MIVRGQSSQCILDEEDKDFEKGTGFHRGAY